MREKPKNLIFERGEQSRNYFKINLLRILHLFLIAMVGRLLSACRIFFPDICARAQVSELMPLSILPEPQRSRDVNKNGLRKVQPKS